MTLNLDDATRSWDVLTRHLESFIDTWEQAASPPSLADHLPIDISIRRFVLVELIKIDLEYREQKKSTPKRIEEYAEEFSELYCDGRLPSDLIYEEYHVRKSAGERVQPQEYLDRFPDNANELRRLLPINSPLVSTALFRVDSPTIDLQPGEQIDDFHLLLKLGKGAFASVFLARQQSMQRLVALKVSADQGSEPQTLAQLDHPNIVRVFDQRQLVDRKMRLLYMQYIAGGTMQAVVDRTRRLPPVERTGQIILDAVDAELQRGGHVTVTDSTTRRKLAAARWPEVVCRIGAQLASALDYAHDKGVLHRDIKPANVLIAADGTPRLADFNISFSSKLDGASPAAYFGGSLAYMSPEQLEACSPSHDRQPDELDGRSDIYSLGVLLWELLCGQRPFQDEQILGQWTTTLDQMVLRRQELALDRQANVNTLTANVRDVLLKCLKPQRDDRYQKADQLARDLLLCLQPRTQRLLQHPAHGWRNVVRRWPVASLLLAAVVPNILSGIFNYFYNFEEIVQHLNDSQQAFWNIQLVINSLSFPSGIAMAGYLSWPVIREVLRSRTGSKAESAEVAKARRRASSIGHYVAIIGIVGWVIAGLAYPLSLHLLVGEIAAIVYLHFAVSLALCGLIAAAYPFFFITFLSVRVFYPGMLVQTDADELDEHAVHKLGGRLGIYLFLAGGVPLLGVMLLVGSSLFTQTQNAIALLVLSIMGALGFGVAFVMYRVIQRDLAALLVAMAPPDPFGASTESVTPMA